MTILAKDNSENNFAKLPLPEPGTVQAVCCGVWDLGLQMTKFQNDDGSNKVQRKVIIAWEISQLINAPESEYNGKPYMLNKTYTLSLGEKANLRKDLESWNGKPFTKEQLEKGVDLEKLYGVNCLLGVKHVQDERDPNKVYANVTAILPPMKGAEKLTPVRAKDEKPPKWVQEKQALAVKDPNDALAEAEENPFGE